jgi:hypothetical protein
MSVKDVEFLTRVDWVLVSVPMAPLKPTQMLNASLGGRYGDPSLTGGLSGYNRESLTVDHSG